MMSPLYAKGMSKPLLRFFLNYTTSVCIFQDVCTENRQICIVKDTEKGVFCTEKDGGFSKKDTYILAVLAQKRCFSSRITTGLHQNYKQDYTDFSLYINTFF